MAECFYSTIKQILFNNKTAQLAEHWASILKVVGSIPTVARHIFQACPMWIHTQSNITNIKLYFDKKMKIPEYCFPQKNRQEPDLGASVFAMLKMSYCNTRFFRSDHSYDISDRIGIIGFAYFSIAIGSDLIKNIGSDYCFSASDRIGLERGQNIGFKETNPIRRT